MEYVPDNLERCPDHPDALVRRIFERDFYVLNGEPAGSGINDRTVRFECANCRRALNETDTPSGILVRVPTPDSPTAPR